MTANLFHLQDGATPLFIACQEGHLPVVKHLIAAKADVNTSKEVGCLPLDNAVTLLVMDTNIILRHSKSAQNLRQSSISFILNWVKSRSSHYILAPHPSSCGGKSLGIKAIYYNYVKIHASTSVQLPYSGKFSLIFGVFMDRPASLKNELR